MDNLMSQDYNNGTWEIMQARVSGDFKDRVFMYCRSTKLNYSVLTRIIWQKILANHKTYQYLEQDPIREIEQSLGEVEAYLPVIVQQKKISPKIYQ